MRSSPIISCVFVALAACHAHARIGPVHAGGGVDRVVQYQVNSLDSSVAFYQQLGFTLDRRDGPVAQLSRDSLTLMLDESGKTVPNRMVLYVDNLDQTYDRLARSGVDIHGPLEPGHRSTEIVIHDPDGNAVELRQLPQSASR